MSRRKLVLIGLISLFVAVPLLIWLIIALSQVRQGVEFIIVPGDATAVINGKEYRVSTESRLRLAPGTYTVTLKEKDFAEEQKEVTVVEGEVAELYMSLKPINEDGKMRVDEHQVERIGGQEVTEGGVKLTEEYDFVKYLPLTRKMFHAYTCRDTPESELRICVRIAVQNDTQKQAALDELKRVGVKVDEVRITFDPPQNKTYH